MVASLETDQGGGMRGRDSKKLWVGMDKLTSVQDHQAGTNRDEWFTSLDSHIFAALTY
jgi:hypothetical protein